MSDASPLLDASGTSGGIPALSTSAKVAIILRRHIWTVAWKVASDVLRSIDIGGLKRFASDDIKGLIEARLISQVVSKKAAKKLVARPLEIRRLRRHSPAAERPSPAHLRRADDLMHWDIYVRRNGRLLAARNGVGYRQDHQMPARCFRPSRSRVRARASPLQNEARQ